VSDPSPIPWVVIWVGCVVVIAGGIIAMSGWGQREPHRTDVFGAWGVGIGAGLIVVTLFVNGGVIALHVFSDIIKTVVASAQPVVSESQAPTR
jgi:hypothetical protein